MSDAEKRREQILTILRKIHDVRFDIEMMAIIEKDEDFDKIAQTLSLMLPVIGNKL